MPQYLHEKRVILLSKTGNPVVKLDNTRTICVADQVHKLLEKIIREQIKRIDLYLNNY